MRFTPGYRFPDQTQNKSSQQSFLAQAMFLARRARAKQYTKIGYGANEDHPDLEVRFQIVIFNFIFGFPFDFFLDFFQKLFIACYTLVLFM